MIESIEVLRLDPEAILPTRGHAEDAGIDIYALEDCALAPSRGHLARTGIAMNIPAGYVGYIANRSSVGKRGVIIPGGVIDAGYRGEILVSLWNMSDGDIEIRKGERIGQMMIMPIALPTVKEVTALDVTPRGEGGFGSTGK